MPTDTASSTEQERDRLMTEVGPTSDRYPTGTEYATRLRAVRAELARRSWAGLVVTDPANLYYLTGYDAWSFYTPQCLLVTGSGPLIFFARRMDAAGAIFGIDRDAITVCGYPEELVHRPDTHPFAWIGVEIVERELLRQAEQIGVEIDGHFFSPRGFLALNASLAPVRLVDSGELVNWVRVIKSDYEQDQLRKAGQIAGAAMRAAFEVIDVGVRQCDAVAAINDIQIRGVETLGGDYPAIVPMLPTGAAAGVPHLTWTDARFVAGEASTIELAGVHHRYHAPLARTVTLGTPPSRLTRLAEVVEDGLSATLQAIRPGVPAADVHRVFDEHLRRHQLSKESRIGYSIGIGYPPDWGERTVSLRPAERCPMSTGMALHVMLGMWMDGWGYELSESIIVGPNGAERLTDVDQTLLVKDTDTGKDTDTNANRETTP